jgi:hypothetical protein
VTSEVPRPDEPSDPQSASESPAPGDHAPDNPQGPESARPAVPGPGESAAEPGRGGTPKGGCALLLAFVVLALLGVSVAPLVLLVS